MPIAIYAGSVLNNVFLSDAKFCFQQWQSCASCHPDARSDGLNWDLLNDGIGTPRQTKSLLLTHRTPPVMITGVRKNAETAVRTGMEFIQFAVRPEEDIRAIDEYLKGLPRVPSPYLIGGKLSDAAARGQKVFEKAGCADCHGGQYLTDQKPHAVGTFLSSEEPRPLDTPALIEVWRTAPYLMDGRAAGMMDVLTVGNKGDRHGTTSGLTAQELKDLQDFVLSQ